MSNSINNLFSYKLLIGQQKDSRYKQMSNLLLLWFDLSVVLNEFPLGGCGRCTSSSSSTSLDLEPI